MPTSAHDRLLHIRERISLIRRLWDGTTFEDASSDETRWPAFERHLEVLSEASRGLPDNWKAQYESTVPWSKVAGLGSFLRHVYQHIDRHILWTIYESDLEPLEAAIDRMIAAHAPTSSQPRSP